MDLSSSTVDHHGRTAQSPSSQDSASQQQAALPSLLPAFEPSPSPQSSAKSSKRKFDHLRDSDDKYYPTPVPTSSTAMFSSSPPMQKRSRPSLQRSVSQLEERAPLAQVPTLDIPADGEPVLMGRSSNASAFQLPPNKIISRVHVKASYEASSPEHPFGQLLIECLGWNGCLVHCQSEVHPLKKGEIFVSDKPDAQVIVDVQETRVILVWPRVHLKETVSRADSRTGWSPDSSPTKQPTLAAAAAAVAAAEIEAQRKFASSPPVAASRLRSPDSPTPAISASAHASFAAPRHEDLKIERQSSVHVFEDPSSEAEERVVEAPPVADSPRAKSIHESPTFTKSRSSLPADLEDFSDDHDEENDPIVHSFGPFGHNLLSRFESFKHLPASPDLLRKSPKQPSVSPQRRADATTDPNTRRLRPSPIKNHVINQLAYSRVHSIPLSTIFNNLPSELRAMADPAEPSLTTKELRRMLEETPCVGEIAREGKDAAGKKLENEFYYLPEADNDAFRRNAVTQGMGKTSLRSVRKQHKQYYWKRPRA